jgi:serine/threonine protein kinase
LEIEFYMLHGIEKFGSYILLEKIAAGGFAEIYLARSKVADGLNKFFAIKRILPHLSSDQDFVTLLKQEAKVALNLNHTNVVSISYFGCENNRYYIVMEYIQGQTLSQIYNEFKKNSTHFSVDQVLYLIKEAALGLDHAHRCVEASTNEALNIIHRDISPKNIMFSFEGAVKVIDFGIAKTTTETNETEFNTHQGKFSYMSPEQAEGNKLDARSDIFSLGVVLWELLTNEKLFLGKSNFEILKNVKHYNLSKTSIRKVNPNVNPQLEQIVLKAIAKKPSDRYQTAADFSRDLNRQLNLNYPHFSVLEFSKSVKALLFKEYQSQREKLVQYSNIKIVENQLEVSFAPVDKYGDTNQAGDYTISQANPATPASHVLDLPEGFEHVEAPILQKHTKNHSFAELAKKTPIQPFESINSTVDYIAPKSVLIENNKVASDRNVIYDDKMITVMRVLKYTIAASIVAFSYSTFNKDFVPFMKNSLITRDLASAKDYLKFQIQSTTSSLLPANDVTTPTQEKTTFEIASENKIGFVNINVSQENPDLRILINGNQILDKPPLIMYPVNADREISIILVDIKTNLHLEKKFIVKNGKTMNLKFDSVK